MCAGGDRPGRKAHHDLAVVDDAATLQGQQWRRPRGKPPPLRRGPGRDLPYLQPPQAAVPALPFSLDVQDVDWDGYLQRVGERGTEDGLVVVEYDIGQTVEFDVELPRRGRQSTQPGTRSRRTCRNGSWQEDPST